MPYQKKASLPALRSQTRRPDGQSGLSGLGAAFRNLFSRKSGSRRIAVYDRYDAVKHSGNRPRRLMDRGSEEAEFRKYDRMYAISLGRDMHRNQARFVALERQIARMTAGTVKCQVNTQDRAWNAAAERYFNKTFARDCLMTIPRTHLSELCQQLVSSLIREGDALVVYDDGRIRGSGKLVVFEADQLVTMASADFARLYPGCTQEAGVILDEYDCIVGYITSAVRYTDEMEAHRPNTLSVLPATECVVYSTDQAVLLASRYRPGQIRGVPEMLPVSICLDDADDMIKSEQITAKRAAKCYATVRLGDASASAMADSELMEAMEQQEAMGHVDPETGELVNPEPAPRQERPHYESIDNDDSAIVTYLDGHDQLDIHDPQRPNLHTDEFYRARNADAAAALGLARGYAEMAVTNSYTAHRGESLLTWAAIYDRQKQLERTLLDWLAEKVISRGISRGEIPPPPSPDWRMLVSWDLPTMPPIDEKTAIEAQSAALKAGLSTYKDLLGSDWEEHMHEYEREISLIRSLNLPLSPLETVSGAPAESQTPSAGEAADYNS